MKFGHNLYRNVVPEWSSSYLDYKALKKGINRIQATTQEREADVAPFLFALDRELEKVDQFFNQRLAESIRRLKLLDEKFGHRLDPLDTFDHDEIGEVVGVLLELRSQLRKLIWFGDVNRRGFVKILKKLDKRININVKDSYLSSKVNEKPFASPVEVTAVENTVNSWLERMGDKNQIDIERSNGITDQWRQKKVSSGAVPGLSTSSVNLLDAAINDDDKDAIKEALGSVEGKDPKVFNRILLNLLQRATTSKALNCIDLLLPLIDSLEEEDDINNRNIIHRLILSLGRKNIGNALPGISLDSDGNSNILLSSMQYLGASKSNISNKEEEPEMPVDANNPVVDMFCHILDSLVGAQRLALLSRDCYGRLPLHYAAQFGFVTLCDRIIQHMGQWNLFGGFEKFETDRYQDAEGFTPLHLAVMGKHYEVTRLLLQYSSLPSDEVLHQGDSLKIVKSISLLILATKINSPELVQLLLDAHLSVDIQDDRGENALHIAARLGHIECAKALLKAQGSQKPDIELREKAFGWTPLFIAAVDGHIDIVDILLEAGADYKKTDFSGWTAQEHAALRGHLGIARRLCQLSNSQLNLEKSEQANRSGSSSDGVLSETINSSHSPITVDNNQVDDSTKQQPQPVAILEPIKSFGHRYLQSKTLILVSLGSKDTRKHLNAVQLEKLPVRNADALPLGNALSLVVSATNASGERAVVDLPVQENISTEPISFETTDITQVRLMFDLIPTYSGSHDGIIGRGVAILSSLKPDVGHGKVSLQGGVQVPLLAATSLEVIGFVNFEFLVITPFSHPNMSVTKNQTYWKSLSTPRVIGHRGLGKNQPSRLSLQLGENTLQSFISAANLGASYVEFDVQLTKDNIPVLYHDFLVGETGIDAPVHDLTLEQFLHISERQTPRSSRPGSPSGIKSRIATIGPGTSQQRRPRSLSLNPMDHHEQENYDKMKYTRAFKLKGFKGNTRGSSIQGPIQTLAGVFKDLPATIGFNIELKYPMLQESEKEDMDTFGIEMNFWVDTVLKVVYDHANGRDLIFSSFNPDICLLLSFKQPSIPVLFLTEAGTEEMADIRACCLKEAIKFASRWNLLGIVSAAEPLVLCPRLVKAVKESGLVCITYGVLNNDTQNVKLQVDQGVDAVIVDSVLAIRKGLTST